MRQFGHGRIGLELGDFAFEQRTAAVVLVAQVHVDAGDADGPRRDQHAFDEAMRVALEVHAVLERAGLAFVDVDGHQARRGLGAHDAPLAAGREPGAAQAAQARGLHDLDDRFDVALAGQALGQQLVAALRLVLLVVDVGLGLVLHRAGLHLGGDGFDGGVRHRVLPDDRHGGLFAAAHARRVQHAYVAAEDLRQFLEQLFRPRHRAGQAVAHAHGECLRCGFAFLDDVEVVVEGSDLVDLGLRQRHLLGQGREVPCREMTEAVLDLVEVLDQEVALARGITQQVADFRDRLGARAPALRALALALPNLRRSGIDSNDFF
jgi:hypothetical protein